MNNNKNNMLKNYIIIISPFSILFKIEARFKQLLPVSEPACLPRNIIYSVPIPFLYYYYYYYYCFLLLL